MSNIDKREIHNQQLKAFITGFLSDPAHDNQSSRSLTAEVFRIALASLEAEPVAWLLSGGGAKNNVSFDSGNAYVDPLREVTPLYTAPPAPVSVPAAMEMDDDFDSAFEHGKAVGWNACRAAMLQGAEQQNRQQNIPENIPFEQWLSQQTGTIDVECGCVMTEVFFHWLRVAYEAGNSSVIPDDVRRMDWLVSKTVDVREPMVYGSHSIFWSQTTTDEEDDYHATKLREQIDAAMAAENAAAPQQEVESQIRKGKTVAREEWELGARLTKHRFKP